MAQAFWPGPLTLVIPIDSSRILPIVRAGLTTAGFRIPRHPLALRLLEQTGPLVMPSANLSGKPSSTLVDHVEEDFGLDFPVLDGGPCQKGLESTILHYRQARWTILRLGALSPDRFKNTLGYCPEIVERQQGEQPLCPGQLFRHYAPKAKLFLSPLMPDECSFILGFQERHYPADKKTIIIGSLNDPEQVAENLYKALRQLDKEQAIYAWVDMDFPNHGLWTTIAERLKRASEG